MSEIYFCTKNVCVAIKVFVKYVLILQKKIFDHKKYIC